ncbi:hypothetical protein ACWDOP_02455 [Nocardia sp. NPDC003693]
MTTQPTRLQRVLMPVTLRVLTAVFKVKTAVAAARAARRER